MRLDCLKNYIGIKGIGATAPDSGLYVNSLPGINLRNIDAIADQDQKNYAGVWNDVQDNALNKFSVDITEKFRPRYKIKKINKAIDLGKKTNPDITSEGLAEYRGFTVETTFKNQFNLVYSNFQSIIIGKVSLYLKEVPGGSVPVKIVDMDTGEVLDTFSIDTPAVGWNDVKVGKIYNSARLFIGYDATGISTYNLYINPNINTIYGGYVTSLYGSVYAEGYIRGAQTKDQDFRNPAHGNDSFGLTGVFSITCSYDSFVCNNKETFALPLQYLMGAELMIERAASDRLNRFTTVDMEKVEGLIKYYQDQYAVSLKQIIDSIDLNTDDACIECNQPSQLIYTTL